MSRDDETFIVWLLACAILVISSSMICLGAQHDHDRREAIKAGVAEYFIDTDGTTVKFRYRSTQEGDK